MAEAENEVAGLTDLVEFPSEGLPAVVDRRHILRRRVATQIGRPLYRGPDRHDLGVRREQLIELPSVPVIEGLDGCLESSNVLIRHRPRSISPKPLLSMQSGGFGSHL